MAIIIWLTVGLLLAFPLTSEAKQKKRSICTRVDIPQCANLGTYKWTVFPNPLTKIQTQKKTAALATSFLPTLTKLNCTKVNALPFLCATYVPKCFPKAEKYTVPPCREYCEEAVGDCPRLAKKFGQQWPVELTCSVYPKIGKKKCLNVKTMAVDKTNKGKRRKNKSKNKKTKGEKLAKSYCCRLGEKAANKNYECSLKNIISRVNVPGYRKGFRKRALKCKVHESRFNSCCTKQEPVAKKLIELKKKRKEERQKKKQNKRINKKQRKEKKRQNKLRKKQDRKNKKLKKKAKKAEKMAKKAEKKAKKANNKSKKRDHKRG